MKLFLTFGFADVEVIKSATIAELKLAVEDVFSHMPKEGPGKISWYVSPLFSFSNKP